MSETGPSSARSSISKRQPPGQPIWEQAIAERAGLAHERVRASIVRQANAGSLLANIRSSQNGAGDFIAPIRVTGATALGLQMVDAWPSSESALRAVIDALEKQAGSTADPVARSKYAEIARWLGSAGRDVVVGALGSALGA